MRVQRWRVLVAAGFVVGAVLGVGGPAEAHTHGGCEWNSFKNPSSGTTDADDNPWEDCANVQARIQVYVGPGTTYSYGPIHDDFSRAQVFSGFLNGSTAGQCANCNPSWSTWRAA